MCSAKKGNEWSSTLFYFKWRLSVSHHPAETGPKVLGPSMDFDIRAKWLFVLAIECRLPREYRQRPTFFLQSRIRLGLFDLALQWITLGMRGRGYAKGASAGRKRAARSMLLGLVCYMGWLAWYRIWAKLRWKYCHEWMNCKKNA